MRLHLIYSFFWSLFLIQNLAISSDFSLPKKQKLRAYSLSFLENSHFWQVNNREETLYEYQLTGDIFSVFDQERNEGIRIIDIALAGNYEVSQFISNAIFNENKNVFIDIFQHEKPVEQELISFSKNIGNKRIYLNALKAKNYPTWVSHNFDSKNALPEDGQRIENTFGLAAALGHLHKKNVYIYNKGADKEAGKLVLIHRETSLIATLSGLDSLAQVFIEAGV